MGKQNHDCWLVNVEMESNSVLGWANKNAEQPQRRTCNKIALNYNIKAVAYLLDKRDA